MMFSEMIAEIMTAFSQFSLEYILKKMSFPQFYHWYDLAIWKLYDVPVKIKSSITAEEIKSKFVWNVEKKRWC